MTIKGYARVSSNRQATDTEALEQQIARLRRAGATEIIEEVESGRKGDRAQFKTLMQEVAAGLVDAVVFTRLDRVGRKLKDILEAVEVFEQSGVRLIILDDGIDTKTPAGRVQLQILGALAEFESNRLEERVRHGWNHVRDTNKGLNAPFGYCVVNGKYVFDTSPFLQLIAGKVEMSKYDIAKDVIAIFLDKGSLRGAVRVINEKYGLTRLRNDTKEEGVRRSRSLFGWGVSGLRQWLVNPVLRGHTRYGVKIKKEDIRYNTHEDILIDPETAEKIDYLLATNKRLANISFDKQKENRHFLSGLVKCAQCKGSCNIKRGSSGGREVLYYQCYNYQLKGCGNKKLVRVGNIEAQLVEILLEAYEGNRQRLEHERSKHEDKWLELNCQLLELNKIHWSNPALEKAKADIQNQIDALNTLIQKQKREPKFNSEKVQELVEAIHRLDNTILGKDKYINLRTQIKEVIKGIWVRDGDILSITMR